MKCHMGGGGVRKVSLLFEWPLTQFDSSFSGPDICGEIKVVHVIFSYRGQNVKIKKDIRSMDDTTTHMYTLIVNPDGTYEVLIDTIKVQSGNLKDDWDYLPPKEIKDPKVQKPEDWDDREKIDDPKDTKPKNWDKPRFIPDPNVKKVYLLYVK